MNPITPRKADGDFFGWFEDAAQNNVDAAKLLEALCRDFANTEGVAQQLIPVLSGNMVFDLSARVWSTSPDDGDVVPFFLLPSLGGSDFLRGFPSYRFRDRDAMLLTAQYRWYVQEYVDGVLFYEAGKVAPAFGDLDLTDLENSYGIGLYFHSARSTLLRLELARSREGLRFIFGFSPLVF